MRRPGKASTRHAPLAETAASWVVREQSGLSERGEKELADWLDQSPAHLEAYAAARDAMQVTLSYAAHPDILDMRKQALSASPEPGPIRSPWVWMAAAACICMSLAAYTMVSLAPRPAVNLPARQAMAEASAPLLKTRIGEQRREPLPDGSFATLNTDTSIRVAYSGNERSIFLLEGQAFFEVAHGNPAPFRVYARDRTITATGTAFDVRIRDDEVEVVLVEGAVEVDTQSVDDAVTTYTTVKLEEGERLRARAGETGELEEANTDLLTSWRAGLVVFRNQSLREAVAEMNRYRVSPIILSDEATRELRVSGTFRLDSPERFAETLTELFPLELTYSEDGSILLSPAGQ